MRFRARLVLGLYGVALAVPAVVMAGPLGDDESRRGDGAWLRRRPRPSPTIIRGCSAAGTASNASAPMSRLMTAWTFLLLLRSSRECRVSGHPQ